GLLALLVLPLYIPVLIFGAGSVSSSMAGISGSGPLSLLGARFLIALVFSPLGRAAAVCRSLGGGGPGAGQTALLVAPSLLPAGRKACALVHGRGGDPGGRRVVPRTAGRPNRFSAGRLVPHHLHPRAGGLDVDADLCRDGVLVRGRPDHGHAAVVHDGARI